MAQNIGICKLCLEKKPLLNKSHILPKFFLNKTLNKENKGFVKMNFDSSNATRVYDNVYKRDILCKSCDNSILGAYEDYASKFYYGNLGKKDVLGIIRRENHFEVENVNYLKLKLFFISILWRCSISSTFMGVQLDEFKNEELRKILFNKAPVPECFLPITIWSYAHLSEIPNEIILPPYISAKDRGEQSFMLVGGGFLIQIIIEHEKISAINKESMLKENGQLKIIQLPEKQMKNYINKIIGWDWLN